MMRITGVLAFAALLVVAAVTEAPAIPFVSAGGTGSCSSTQVVCAAVVALTNPNALWTANNFNGNGGVWVSYAQTGTGGIIAPNAPNLTTPTATFSVNIPAGFTVLNLRVWADDTAGIRLDGTAIVAPNPVQGATCANGFVTCTGNGTASGTPLAIPLGGLAHTIQFDTFQVALDTFGLMYQGDLVQAALVTPEPATLLLVGSAFAAAGVISRRRIQKRGPQPK